MLISLICRLFLVLLATDSFVKLTAQKNTCYMCKLINVIMKNKKIKAIVNKCEEYFFIKVPSK